MEIAEAFVTVRAKTDQVQSDIRKGVDSAVSGMKPIEPKADARKAGKQVEDDLTTAGKRGGEAAGKGFEAGILGSARSAVSTIGGLFVGAKFIQSLTSAVDKASDLNEAVSLSKTVFGELAPEIEKVGDTAATQFGMSKRAFIEAANGLDNLLTNMGYTKREAADTSVKLVGLASDLASAFNTDPVDALAALQSALIGETEPIRRYGVILNEAVIKQEALTLGLYSGKGALDANAKAQATLSLIMKGTVNAQGDFARTSDGLANSQRILAAKQEDAAASMGKNFLPVYKAATKLVGELADIFGSLPAPIQTGVIALVGITALAGPLRTVVDVVKSLGTAVIQNLGTLGTLTAVIAVAGLAYSAYSSKKAEAVKITNDFAAALEAERSGQQGAIDDLIVRQLEENGFLKIIQEKGIALRDVIEAIKTNNGLEEIGHRLAGMNVTAQGTYVDLLKQLASGYDRASDSVKRKADADAELAAKQGSVADTAKNVKDVIDILTKSAYDGAQGWGTYGTSVDAMTGGIGRSIEAIQAEEDAINDLIDAQLALFDATFAQHDAQIEFAQSIGEANKASLEAAAAGKGNALAQVAAQQAMDGAAESALKVAEANVRVAEEQANAAGTTLDVNEKNKILVDTLRGLAKQAGGPVADTLNAMALQLENVGKQHPNPTVDANTDPLKNKTKGAKGELDSVDKTKPNPTVNANIDPLKGKSSIARNELRNIDNQRPNPAVNANINPLQSKSNIARNELRNVDSQRPNPQVNANINPLQSKSAIARNELRNIDSQRPSPVIGATDRASSIFSTVRTRLSALNGSSATVNIGANASSFNNAISNAAARLRSLSALFGGTRAAGGPIWPGTWLVGEQGPELLRINTSGRGEVLNATKTRDVMRSQSEGRGGDGLVVNGNVIVGTRQDLRSMTSEIDRLLWLKRNGGG